ncbi:MAG: DUF2812 domain-containing protein [Clostridia bacterium]|nr:DUF2812 domain-containing protein [Clostridia bacterium]
MKDRKTEFRYFTIADYEREQDYLRRMHSHGWKFVHVAFPGFYHFESCAPEDVIYQLDYNPEGRAQREEYVRMFEDCGWEYVQDFVGYSYFRKPAALAKADEGIFCDDDSRLDMMKRVFRGRMLPMLCVFCGIIIPQLYMQFRQPIRWLIYTYMALFLLYVLIFSAFAIQYWRYRNRRK